ncbi:hypothetical protein F4055_02025, partial [Candidatus Poribacteria bacterium]|nr:hypothetical protein [Candidatus Poribacteria bacterium]
MNYNGYGRDYGKGSRIMPQTGANRAAASMTIGFESVKETQFLSSNLIVSILIVLFSITGCSDAPHVGSMLTADRVDRYITSTEASVCLENTCITVIPEFTDRTDGIEGPIIHIHPDNFSYIIYRKSASALPAEAVRRSTRDGGGDGGGRGGGGSGDGGDGGDG